MQKKYINPTLEVVEVAVEAGIATSGGLIPPSNGGAEAGALAFEDEI